jgi:hypothetical protein
MSVTLWLALVLQFASVALLRLFLGKMWLRRPGTLLVLASVVYDGVSQVLLSFPSVGQWDTLRNGIQQSFIGEADLVMSAGILAFTVAYLLACGPRRETAPLPADAAKVLDWRILALMCLPLAVLTYEGRGYANGTLTTGAGAPLVTSFAGEFFTLLIVLAAFAFLLRHGKRWFVPALIAQSLLLAAAGERNPVITDAIVLVLLLCLSGCRPRRSHMHAAAALTVLAVLAITGLRAEQGRSVFYADSGLGTRVEALSTGLRGQPVPGTPGLAAQFAVRLDGTAFAGGIFQARHDGQPALSPAGVPESLLLAVPSEAWHGKLADGALNPVVTELDDFGLQKVNFLPGFAGLYAGFLSPPWLIAFLGVAGALWGRAERWMLAARTPARLALLAGAFTAALEFEAGGPTMLIALRAAAVIAAAAWAAGAVRARKAAAPGYPARRRMMTPLPPLPPLPRLPPLP